MWPLFTPAPNLHFRAISPSAGERVSAVRPWALNKLSQFLCIHAPLAPAPSCHGGDPGPCGLHHHPQNSFSCVSSILEWIWWWWWGGCLVSHSPHSHCFFQISKLPRATPHTWLCHLCIWLAPSLSWRSLSAPSRRAPALSWHGFPSSRSGRHPGVLWLCGPALETHAGC